MSLSSVFTLALVLKKFTRKAALRKQAQRSASLKTKLSATSDIEQTLKLQSSSSSTTRASAPTRYSESETSLQSEQQKDELDTTVAKPIEIPPLSTTEEEQLEDLGPEDPSGKSWSASLAAASLFCACRVAFALRFNG
ncbi:hypothetical protein K450DRAFT_232150 [Umbelopsis ramanniana AG]|uniref:Uncharacterized protein n=1 Tax=Umbelopsis ramanniana AG TaxID=1314678 RepID=A0AAD5EEA9_UMBRA|nr:uncharacterized protein K450DRAFT_232150 [Umbelopsis ramanniana AG]KAI8581614.1 hypothetical protein K450DRAFT_232150 [Umbelopsis ramanniana AG]